MQAHDARLCYNCLKEWFEEHSEFIEKPMGERDMNTLPNVNNAYANMMERKEFGKVRVSLLHSLKTCLLT